MSLGGRGRGRGRILGEITWFSGGFRGGGESVVANRVFRGDYGKLTVNEGRGVIRILKN